MPTHQVDILDAPSTAVGHALASSEPAWLDRSLFPFRARRFELESRTLTYVDEGAGRPILFVHGTPSWSFEWRHAIGALRAERRCVALDHLGFGLSDKPETAAYRPADHAARLLAFVRALDLRELTLVLHDFGGPIGLPVLLEEPERVRSLVVVNSWAWAHGDDPRIARLSRFVASPLGRFMYTWLNASPRWLVPASAANKAAFTPAVRRHYTGPFGNRRERLAPWVLGCELAGSDAFYEASWQRRSQLLNLPVHLIWGERDPAFGPDYLARWRAALPHARVTLLHDAGHFPQEEQPEAFCAALRTDS